MNVKFRNKNLLRRINKNQKKSRKKKEKKENQVKINHEKKKRNQKKKNLIHNFVSDLPNV